MEMDALIRTKVLTRLDAPIFGVLGAYFYHLNQTLFYKFRYWFLAGSVLFALAILGVIYSMADLSNLLQTTMSHPFIKTGTLLYFDLLPLSILFAIPFVYYLKTDAGALVRFVTTFSKLSYSIYLVHASLVLHTLVLPYILPTYFQWAGSHVLKIGFLLYIVLTVCLSVILYQLIEMPFYRLKQRMWSVRPAMQTVAAEQRPPSD